MGSSAHHTACLTQRRSTTSVNATCRPQAQASTTTGRVSAACTLTRDPSWRAAEARRPARAQLASKAICKAVETSALLSKTDMMKRARSRGSSLKRRTRSCASCRRRRVLIIGRYSAPAALMGDGSTGPSYTRRKPTVEGVALSCAQTRQTSVSAVSQQDTWPGGVASTPVRRLEHGRVGQRRDPR